MTLGNKYLAEEITQITFVKLWDKIDSLDNELAMLSYLYKIAKNQFLNYCEHETIEFIYYNYVLNHNTEQDITTEKSINERFFNEYLIKVLNELPPQRKKVFSMSKLEGKSNKEIADELQLSPNTVERHMSLALQYIRSRLSKYYNVLFPIIVMSSLANMIKF